MAIDDLIGDTFTGDIMAELTVAQRLAEPFDPKFVKFKPQTVQGNRCLAVAYLDVRAVLKRLDDVLGLDGWQDDYEALPSGAFLCRLQIRIGDTWITKVDVGGQSEQTDEGDRLKSAVSDALKRAAVKCGIGRYIYYLPKSWVDYDPQKRQLVRNPTLPPWALPKPPERVNGVKTDPANNTVAARAGG